MWLPARSKHTFQRNTAHRLPHAPTDARNTHATRNAHHTAHTAITQDDKWAAAQRQGRPTDAILSCPGCFTTLCLECQQHALLPTQYRAVFTLNTRARADAPVRVPCGGGGGGGGRKRKGPEGDGGGGGGGAADASGGGEVETMIPVECEVRIFVWGWWRHRRGGARAVLPP